MRTLALFLSLSTAAFGVCPESTAIRTKWDLWAHGTCLRGANIWQKVIDASDGDALGPGPVGPTYDQASFDRLAALGANYVNVSFPGLYTEQPPYRTLPEIAAYLDALIERARRADLFVVLSFRTGPGRNEATFDKPSQALVDVWRSAEAQDAWVAMWRETAGRYRDHATVVGYDLMVEPNANEILFHLDEPQAFYPQYTGTLADWNPLAKRLTRAIREVDASTPILVGAMGDSAVGWLGALATTGDSRTVYTVHQYEPFEYTHQGTTRVAPPSQSALSEILEPLAAFQAKARAPLAANEFGAVRWASGVAQFTSDSIALFEARGMAHAVWLWETSLPIDYDQFNFRFGPDPTIHADVSSSAYLDALASAWKRNGVRPSRVSFE